MLTLQTLKDLGVSKDIQGWAATQPDAATAWDACPRGDWLLCLAGKLGLAPQKLVKAACKCARLGLTLLPADEDRPRHAIKLAEGWADGNVPIEDVRVAANAAAALAVGKTDTFSAVAWAAAWAADAADTYVAASDSVCAVVFGGVDLLRAAEPDSTPAETDGAREFLFNVCAGYVRSVISFNDVAVLA